MKSKRIVITTIPSGKILTVSDNLLEGQLQWMIYNILDAPADRKESVAKDLPTVEIPITDETGTCLNTFVIANTGRQDLSGRLLYLSFWRRPCTLDDVDEYVVTYGRQHPAETLAFDIHDAILGCVGMPLMSYGSGDAIAVSICSYNANLGMIFDALKGGIAA